MNRTALIATTLFAIGTAGAAIDEPVRLDTGMISGATTGSPDVRVFKGIPYAAPPVGDLRWRAPKPAAHWEGTRAADQFGPVCMQGGNQKMSEDCLYLNVWTGAKAASEKRPVMLWIYGGGYYTGSGSQPMYDGEALAKKGAVVVTFNYRLGAFGFFSHPELTKESDRRGAANFGVMDSIAALQWVQRNIARFGGDPKHVTIFGESAGAGMVANLMTIPSAKGLFVRAMGESSAWSTARIAPLSTLAEAELEGVKLADAVGAKSLAELRAKPAEVDSEGRTRAGAGGGRMADSGRSGEGFCGGQADRRAGAGGIEPRRVVRGQSEIGGGVCGAGAEAVRRPGGCVPETLPGGLRRRGARIGVLFGTRRDGVHHAELGAAGGQARQVESVRILLHPAAAAVARTREGRSRPGRTAAPRTSPRSSTHSAIWMTAGRGRTATGRWRTRCRPTG